MSDDEFDELWEQYVEVDRELSDLLGLDPPTDDTDTDRKGELRDLWGRGELVFAGSIPVFDARSGGGDTQEGRVMSDDEQPAGDDVSVTSRLWLVVWELQDIRQHDDIDRLDEHDLKTAIAEVEGVRKSVKSKQGDTDAGP